LSLSIMEDRVNPLVRRRELVFRVEHPDSATPTAASLRERLAALLGSKPEATFIVNLKGLAGLQRSEGICHIYSSPNDGQNLEPEHIRRLNMTPEERKKVLEDLKKARASKKAKARTKGASA
jgi:small subunit ribosomal protein S24e